MKASLTLEQKYDFYEKSVQNPEVEVIFMHDQFKKVNGRAPFTLREDFCGTGAISCMWVKQNKKCKAYGVDLDEEPLKMGFVRHYSKLNKDQQKRMHYLKQNVLSAKAPKVDIVCAFNFSYYIFHTRKDLVKYFKSVRRSLKSKGMFFIDLFGGPESQKLVTDVKKLRGLTYYWECQHFNPISHDCVFAIHFKDKKGKKHKNVFTYHWRFWMLPELRDIMSEAGFKTVTTYWEGDGPDGTGDGIFTAQAVAENSDAWVSYLVGQI